MPTNLISNFETKANFVLNLTINQQLSVDLVNVKMQTCRCITFNDLQSLTLFNRCPPFFSNGNHYHLHSSTNLSLNPKTRFTTHYKKEKGVNYLFHNLMETLNPDQCIQNRNLTRVQLSSQQLTSNLILAPAWLRPSQPVLCGYLEL
jgi:hypothetical protein